jgi:hypothetical protein
LQCAVLMDYGYTHGKTVRNNAPYADFGP